MPGPWEQYQAQPSQPQPQASQPEPQEQGPWTQYAQAQPEQTQQPQAQQPGLMDQLKGELKNEFNSDVDFGKGLLKGAYQLAGNVTTGLGIDKLMSSDQRTAMQQAMQKAQPSNYAQKVGAFAGKSAPLMLAPEAEGGMLSRMLYNSAVGAISGASDSGDTKGAAIGGALGGVMGPLANLMKGYARTLYSTAINPTKLDAKAATASTLLNGTSNDLVGRGVWSMSLRGLHQKLDLLSQDLGQKVESTISKLDKQGTLNFQTILNAAQKEIDTPGGKFNMVTPHTGKVTEATQAKYESALETMSHVIDMVSQDAQPLNGVTYKTAQFVRQQLDNAIWGDKLTPDLKQEAKKFSYYLANQVREAMNSNAPDLAEVNNDFHVIKTAVKAIGYTLERKTGQQGVATKLDSMIGEQLGSLMGHPLAGLAVGAAQKSTAYRTGGAVLMDRAAKHSAKASAALGKFAADQWNKIQIGDSQE